LVLSSLHLFLAISSNTLSLSQKTLIAFFFTSGSRTNYMRKYLNNHGVDDDDFTLKNCTTILMKNIIKITYTQKYSSI
jgi:hypothetical protein